MLTQQIKQIADKIYPGVVAFRRQLHQNPGLAFNETYANALVRQKLSEWGIPYREVAQTGVVGLIQGRGEGKTVALRADMDALPLTELNNCQYKSQTEGLMHACGHDAHTAWLLGTAYILNVLKDQWSGNVKLFFQPAEEGQGGAQPMIAEGVMENPKVDWCIGGHVTEEYEAGQILLKDGAVMASPDDFTIVVKGKGGHGAHPESCIDPIIIACNIVNALQTVVSRSVAGTTPAVISVCAINGGTAFNIIPETCEIRGTARSVDTETREKLRQLIERTANGIANSMGGEIDFNYRYLYPPTINDIAVNRVIEQAAAKVLGENKTVYGTEPSMGGEDFAYFAQAVPSSFIKVGIANKEKGIVYPIHSPHFDIDESALKTAMLVLAQSAVDLL